MPFKTESSRVISAGKFLELRAVTYTDDRGTSRIWESVDRRGGQGAVLLIATLEPSGRFLLIRQFRAPAGKYVIEFPAGLVDPGETCEKAAVRELYEETGYSGEITLVRPPCFSSPGLSGETIAPVRMRIDESAYPSPPRQHLESTESIEVFALTKEEIPSFLRCRADQGDGIDTKVALLFDFLQN